MKSYISYIAILMIFSAVYECRAGETNIAANKVRFENCSTVRAPAINGQTPCLASPGGGPQIGQSKDRPSTGHLIKSCRFEASGDDAVAFFNACGEIKDCVITDAFARGILLYKSPETILTNNIVLRCPIVNGE